MPVDFLTSEQKARYGKFSGEPNEMQLSRYFILDETDLEFISKCRGEQNRLAVALQLTSLRFLGTFILDLNQIPNMVKKFVASQLKISIAVLSEYSRRDATKWTHARLIREQYGYHEFENPWIFRLSRLLFSKAWVSNERPSIMFDFSTAWLIEHKILLPGTSTLIRLISEIRERSFHRLWRKISVLPSKEQEQKLEALLKNQDNRKSDFDRFKQGPTKITSPAFREAIWRYKCLVDFEIQPLDFTTIPPVRLKHLARYASIVSVPKISRMPREKRISILVAYVKVFEIHALDDALDVLDGLLSDIISKAKKIGHKKRLRTLKDLDKSAIMLAEVCNIILDENMPDNRLRQIIFTQLSKEKLLTSIQTIHALARPKNEDFQTEMIEQYGRVRHFLPTVLNELSFMATPEGKNTLKAFDYMVENKDSRKKIFENPPLEIIGQAWKRLVFNSEKLINRQAYTLCFLDKLQDSLRRRDVYVHNSERWGDTRQKLLQGAEWLANRTQVCRSLGHPVKPQIAIADLLKKLDETYQQVIANFDSNKEINLDNTNGQPSLTIGNLDKLDEPPSLIRLREKVNALIPRIDLTELLLEINAHTGFLDAFTHISESNPRATDLNISVCAVLLVEACNLNLEDLVDEAIPALTRYRLNWTKQNYYRIETIVEASTKLVDYQSTLELAQIWGGGEVASADGMRFVVPIKTIHAGANRKYFGSSKGITWYNFLSDQYSGFHGIVIPGTLRDSIFVLEGLLEQQTSLRPQEIMTDTAGSSDMVFGLFWLLGYQFSPRLADAGEAVFYRSDKDADYGVLDELARGRINPKRIEDNWDDMMRVAGSLKLGTVQASELTRSLLKSDKPSSLAKAIIEVGHINKTLYLLNYIDDIDYRRRILTQLNRGESRHALARKICHGHRGEIRKQYKDGQEDQLGALGLVTNAVVLWNTIYLQAALQHLEAQGESIKTEDKARLSPLINDKLNVLGHFNFILAENVSKDSLRPLNQPIDSFQDP